MNNLVPRWDPVRTRKLLFEFPDDTVEARRGRCGLKRYAVQSRIDARFAIANGNISYPRTRVDIDVAIRRKTPVIVALVARRYFGDRLEAGGRVEKAFLCTVHAHHPDGTIVVRRISPCTNSGRGHLVFLPPFGSLELGHTAYEFQLMSVVSTHFRLANDDPATAEGMYRLRHAGVRNAKRTALARRLARRWRAAARARAAGRGA